YQVRHVSFSLPLLIGFRSPLFILLTLRHQAVIQPRQLVRGRCDCCPWPFARLHPPIVCSQLALTSRHTHCRLSECLCRSIVAGFGSARQHLAAAYSPVRTHTQPTRKLLLTGKPAQVHSHFRDDL